MSQIVISEEGRLDNIIFTVTLVVSYIITLKCGVLLEVSMSGYVCASSRSCPFNHSISHLISM